MISHRTVAINQIHGFLLEFVICLPIGVAALHRVPALLDDPQHPVPLRLKGLVLRLHHQIQQLNDEIKDIESDLKQQLKEDDTGGRLQSIPGIGPITASALLADVGDASNYRSGRDFAASLGLVSKQNSTGGKTVLLGISKRGDKHIRRLLVQGAPTVSARSAANNRLWAIGCAQC